MQEVVRNLKPCFTCNKKPQITGGNKVRVTIDQCDIFDQPCLFTVTITVLNFKSSMIFYLVEY